MRRRGGLDKVYEERRFERGEVVRLNSLKEERFGCRGGGLFKN